MHDPKTSHAAELKQVLRYLKGALSYGLMFKYGDEKDLVGYVDSGHNIDEDDGNNKTFICSPCF